MPARLSSARWSSAQAAAAQQEGTQLSPNDVDSLVAAAGADDESLRALADSASGNSSKAKASDPTASGIAQPGSTTRSAPRQSVAADQPEVASFVDQANTALGWVPCVLRSMVILLAHAWQLVEQRHMHMRPFRLHPMARAYCATEASILSVVTDRLGDRLLHVPAGLPRPSCMTWAL